MRRQSLLVGSPSQLSKPPLQQPAAARCLGRPPPATAPSRRRPAAAPFRLGASTPRPPLAQAPLLLYLVRQVRPSPPPRPPPWAHQPRPLSTLAAPLQQARRRHLGEACSAVLGRPHLLGQFLPCSRQAHPVRCHLLTVKSRTKF